MRNKLQRIQKMKKSRFSTSCFVFVVAARVFAVEQFRIRRWKANGKTNLMISKHLKIGRLQPEKLRNMFERIQKMKKSRVCAVYSTYTVTPIPCYLFHAAQLVRTKTWSLLSSHSKNQKIADGRVK